MYEGYHKSDPLIRLAIKKIDVSKLSEDISEVKKKLAFLEKCRELNSEYLLKFHAYFEGVDENKVSCIYVVLDKCTISLKNHIK